MHLADKQNDQINLRLTRDEAGILRAVMLNLLQPVAMGPEYDLTKSTGESLRFAQELFNKIRNAYDASEEVYRFSSRELTFLRKALEDAPHYIGKEFQTLTGYIPREAQELQAVLAAI